MSDSNAKSKACWWACLPERRSDSAEQDLMTQGNVDLVGRRESFRMDEKARRASTEKPLRAKSAMTEFQLETLVPSTYLMNQALRLLELFLLSETETEEEEEDWWFLKSFFAGVMVKK